VGPNAVSQPKSTAFHIESGGFMNAGTGRAAERSQLAMALTTGRELPSMSTPFV